MQSKSPISIRIGSLDLRNSRLPASVFLFALLISSLQHSSLAQTEDPLSQHYQAAAKFLGVGDQAAAAAEYRAFLAEALHRVANGRSDAGQFDFGFRLFDEALQLSPGDSGIQFDYAKACLDADKLLKAKPLAESVASANAGPQAVLLLGRVLFHLGEFAKAKIQLERAFAEDPKFNTGYLLGKTYLLLNDEMKARTLFDGMATNFGDTVQAQVLFGRAYSETDHRAQAIEEFRKAIAKDDRARDVHYYLGLTYLGKNEAAGYDQAIPEFRAELERNKHDFRSHYMLGYIELRRRNFAEAQRELSAALAEKPRDLQTVLQLAEVYIETDRAREAEDSLRRAISEADPSENEGQVSRAHYLLGRIFEKSGRRPQAIQEFQIVGAIQKRLGPSSAQTADARTREAQDESTTNASPEKVAQLEQFVNTLKSPIADSYNNLGAIAAQQRNYAQAVTCFQKAGEWDPGLEGLDRNLGRAAFLAGQLEIAIPSLSRYLDHRPDDASARSILGLALFRSGDYRKVVEVLTPIKSAIESNAELWNAYNVSLSKLGQK